MVLYTLVSVTNFRGNLYTVLQDGKKILCYPVGWLACTISITVVSGRPIICNLVEIAVLELLQTRFLLLLRVLVYLIKRIKRKRKEKRHYLSYFLDANELIMQFDSFPPFSSWVSVSHESKERMCL